MQGLYLLPPDWAESHRIPVDSPTHPSPFVPAGALPFATLIPDQNNPGVVNVTICEYRVGAVEIQGNSKTKDYVIRRLLRLRTGDLITIDFDETLEQSEPEERANVLLRKQEPGAARRWGLLLS